MTDSAPGPLARLARSLCFRAGSAVDALVAPVAALRGKHRVSREALLAAGLPLAGAYAADVRRVRLRRLQRRLKLRLVRRGPAELAGALDVVGLDRLRAALAAGRGAILVSTHGGPPEAVPAALRLRGFDVFELREARPPAWDPPLRAAVFPPDAHTSDRASGLVACLRELRGGGVVRLAFEGHARRSLRGEHAARLGSVRVPAGGGATALARLSGAPALPVVASVSASGRARVVIGEPVTVPSPPGAEPAAWEAAFVEAANAAFEALLADDPVARMERLVWAVEIRGWASRRSVAAPPGAGAVA